MHPDSQCTQSSLIHPTHKFDESRFFTGLTQGPIAACRFCRPVALVAAASGTDRPRGRSFSGWRPSCRLGGKASPGHGTRRGLGLEAASGAWNRKKIVDISRGVLMQLELLCNRERK